MNQMINKALAVLWCVVVCGSHPHDFIGGLQLIDNVFKTAPTLIDMKKKLKRTTIQHSTSFKFVCTVSESLRKKCDDLNYVQLVDPSLMEDSGFQKNLDIVFRLEENTTEQYKNDSNISLFYEDILNTNENNTGLDDRLRGKETFYRRYNAMLFNSPNEHDDNPDTARLLKETNEDNLVSSSEAQKSSIYVYFINLLIIFL